MPSNSSQINSTGESEEVGEITIMTYVSVDAWVKRYKDFGIEGLINRLGQGRKSIIKETDKESILQSLKARRQRIQTAKAEWGKNLANLLVSAL